MRASSLFLFVAVVASLFLATTAGTVKFLSFDAGLLVGVDKYAVERLDNINYELALLSLSDLAGSVDVMCLQGYFLPYQVYKLAQIISPYLPHNYVSQPSTGTCFCLPEQVAGLQTCLVACSAYPDQLSQQVCASGCLANPSVQASMGQVCSNCISGQLNNIVTQQTTITNAVGACVNASMSGASGDDCMAYGGYSGNALFSRVPLLNATTISLPVAPKAFNNDALYARVNLDGLDDVHLFCTQFMPIGPDQSPVVMAGLEQLNLGQAVALAQTIATVTQNDPTKKVVLMGNFKESPNTTENGIEPYITDGYNSWLQQGFVEPAMEESETTKCTYCTSLVISPTLNNTMSSHIFLRGFTVDGTKILSIEPAQTLTTKTTILDLSTAAAGTAQSVPYSPNYGVAVEFTTMSSATSLSSALLSAVRAVLMYITAQ